MSASERGIESGDGKTIGICLAESRSPDCCAMSAAAPGTSASLPPDDGAGRASAAPAVLETYRVRTDTPIYVIGTFDKGVTVLSQQIRALNLAWALIENRDIPTLRDRGRCKLAIIGAGFAGLTFAAALLYKQALVDITIFEERDTLIPLQQGSDSRWLHPNIYDWPGEGSEASVAMLPVLNWTAARASDVVVQVLGEWRHLVHAEVKPPKVRRLQRGRPTLKLFCNTRHLQVDRCTDGSARAQLEWIGEERNPADCTILPRQDAATGSSEAFDLIILAVGFGLEIHTPPSYWRNETLGQPSLDQPRRTYLVSGQGDGAMIDLLRLRISQFRQDRILEELFDGAVNLLEALKKLKREFDSKRGDVGLFERFEQIANEARCKREVESVRSELAKRLRRDTEVILRLKERNLTGLLDGRKSGKSFQNALLVYLLYRCGGFAISTEKVSALTKRFSLSPEQIVRRHGTKRRRQLKRLLSHELYEAVKTDLSEAGRLEQHAGIRWKGGYFGHPARSTETAKVADRDRRSWRKEYLPGPTALLATTLCGTLVGELSRLRPTAGNFRVTLHRTLSLHNEELLQQACDYLGVGRRVISSTAGRTFPATEATIGLAYSCRAVVRSKKGIGVNALQDAMQVLNLKEASRTMAKDVRFLLAIPILQPSTDFFLPSPVAGVLYIDSEDEDFWLSDDELGDLCTMVSETMKGIQGSDHLAFIGLRNIRQRDVARHAAAAADMRPEARHALEIVEAISPPRTSRPFVFNFDHSDLAPLAVATEGIEVHVEPEQKR